MWKLRSVALSWPRKGFTSNPTLLVAFCSSTSREHAQGDGDLKNAIKSRIYQALERKEEDVARKQLHSFFSLTNVTLLDCNQMLKACWSNVNAQVAHLIWMFMLEKQIRLNTYSVACLLSALCKGEKLDQALKLLYKLGEDIDVQPHIDFCSIFLNGCWYAGSAFHAEKCLRFIKEKGLKADELVYLELLKLAGRRKDLRAVHKAWSLMVKCCQPAFPCLQSYCAAIKALCHSNSLAEALITLREMVQLIAKNEGFLLSERRVGILSLLNSEEMMHSDEIIKIKQGKEVLENTWEKEALVSGDKVDSRKKSGGEAAPEKSCNLSASGLPETSVTEGNTAPRADTKMQDDIPLGSKGEDGNRTGETFFYQILGWTRLAMVNLQQSELQDLPESLQSVETPITWPYEAKFDRVRDILRESFNAIISTAVTKGEFRSAEVLFSQMRAVGLKPNINSYNAMLRAVVAERGLAQGFQLVKSMETIGVQPNTRTYNTILEGFCTKMEVDKAEALLERMLVTGGHQGPSVTSFNIILKSCGMLDDALRACRVFSKMVEADIKPDLITIHYLVRAFGRVNFPYKRGTQESHNELARRLQAIEIYMQRSNLAHNFQSFTTVLAAFSTEGMADTVMQRLCLAEGRVGGDGLPILTTASFNTAINAFNQAKQWAAADDVLKRMRAVGLKPNRETYNVFMNGCAEQKKVAEAFHYLDKIQEEELKPNTITYNTLIKVCCYARQLDAAVKLLRDMEQSGLTPSDVTYVLLLRCAVKKERIDMVELLVEHMHRNKIQPTISICELVVSAYLKCHQIEDAAEALRVLSTRMLPEGLQSAGQSENILEQIFLEDSLQVEESTLELLKDAMTKQGAVSEALLAARLSGFGNASMGEWNAQESWWVKRLRAQYIKFS